MWRYLKAAFWARIRVPVLGFLPLIAVATGGFAIAGIAFPLLWLLGLGFIGGLTFGLAHSNQFRRGVDAIARTGSSSVSACEFDKAVGE